MTQHKFAIKWIGIFAALVLVGAGCGGGGGNQADYGVYRSADKGETWGGASAVLTTSGEQQSLHQGVDVLRLVQDPVDEKVMYAITRSNGLWYTHDAGRSWDRPREERLTDGRVFGFAIHPSSPCTLYASTGNTLLKSTTCARSWVQIHATGTHDDGPNVITDVAINIQRPSELYLGTLAGSVLKSEDAGVSWRSVHREKNARVKQMLVDPFSAQTAYVAYADDGIFRTQDGGATWVEVSPDKRDFRGSDEYSTGVFDPTTPDRLIIATKYGLLVTVDNGTTWEAMNLVSAPGEALIFSIAISPNTNNEIYYGTLNAFYRSKNGGETWETQKIPTRRAVTALMVDRSDTKVVYLGATKLGQ